MINKILIPTDFSPASWRAIMYGIDMANLDNSKITLLHVYPVLSKYSNDVKELKLPTKLVELKKKMDEFSGNLLERGSSHIDNVVLAGNVEETILKYIEENDFKLVIVGVNGNGVNNEIGSHTSSLIEKSNTPVLIIPNQKATDEASAAG